MSLLNELKRRNVFRVGLAYLVTAWVIAQVASLVLNSIKAPDWVMQTLLLLLGLGFVIALIIAWAYELTPEGIKKEKEVTRDDSITNITAKKLDYITLVAAVVVIGLFGYQQMNPPAAVIPATPNEIIATETIVASESSFPKVPDTIDRNKSIAVLPFADFSSGGDQEWFSDGLTEEILNSLTRIPDLLVTSRTSSFKYKNTNEEIPIIAEKLGVTHVLEGSVRRGGDRIRITAQLIRANDGFHLWSETYDSSSDDVIEIQEDIAVKIATALKTAMDPQALAEMADIGTKSIPAYEAYLEGKALERQGLGSNNDLAPLLRANQAFEKARTLDPEFSQAHFRAAGYWNKSLTSTTSNATDAEDIDGDFREYLSRLNAAIGTEKNENRKLKYQAALALSQFDTRGAIGALEKYLEQYPLDISAWERLSDIYAWSARYKDASAAAAQGEKVADPTDLEVGRFISQYVWAKDYENAARLSRSSLKGGSNNSTFLYQAHRALLWAGDIDEARSVLARLETSDVATNSLLVSKIRQACGDGNRSAAEAFGQELREAFPDESFVTHWHMYALFNDQASATAVLREFDRARPPVLLTNWLFYPYFDHTKFPNFVKFLKREGIDRPPPVEIPFKCPPPEQSAP